MLTNTQFHQFLINALKHKWVYWYGTYGKKCTLSLYNSKKRQYPDHYKEDRTSKYMQQIKEGRYCADCIGLAKAFVWSNGVFEGVPKYNSNGMPDKSADGMYAYAKKQGLKNGLISTIPEIPGIAVRMSGHVGFYIGNGEVIEERGFSYGCVKTKLKDRKWVNWYELPGVTYTEQPQPEPEPEPEPTPTPVPTSECVLVSTGKYHVRLEPNTDGRSIGIAHKGDVLPYRGLIKNNWYGVTYNNQSAWISAKCGEIVGQSGTYFTVKKGSWNIRSGPKTTYSRVTIVHEGDKIKYLGKEENNWYYVKAGKHEGWISSKAITK